MKKNVKILYIALFSCITLVILGFGILRTTEEYKTKDTRIKSSNLINSYNNSVSSGDILNGRITTFLSSNDEFISFDLSKELGLEKSIYTTDMVSKLEKGLHGLKEYFVSVDDTIISNSTEIDEKPDKLKDLIESKEVYYFLDDISGNVEQLITFVSGDTIYKVSILWEGAQLLDISYSVY